MHPRVSAEAGGRLNYAIAGDIDASKRGFQRRANYRSHEHYQPDPRVLLILVSGYQRALG